jgi:ricin-type beta-trefoil lectin protein
MSTKYVIQFTGQVNQPQPTNFCLGVATPGINAPVVLSNLSFSLNNQWTLDPVSGYITSAADPSLCLSFTGTSPSNGTPLVLQQPVPGSLNQQWNWSGNSPRIISNSFPNYAIDDSNCTQTPSTPLQMYSLSGQCQAWRLITVAQAQEFAKAAQ